MVQNDRQIVRGELTGAFGVSRPVVTIVPSVVGCTDAVGILILILLPQEGLPPTPKEQSFTYTGDLR